MIFGWKKLTIFRKVLETESEKQKLINHSFKKNLTVDNSFYHF